MAASSHDPIYEVIQKARRKLLLRSAARTLLKALIILLPVAAVLIAADQRWGGGQRLPWILAGVCAAAAMVLAFAIVGRMAAPLKAAMVVDQRARLKDRLSSALEFLEVGRLDSVRELQVNDAADHARRINLQGVLAEGVPRSLYIAGAMALLLFVSLLVPPAAGTLPAEAAIDQEKQAQLEAMRELHEDLEEQAEEEEVLRQYAERLQELEKKYSESELSERDMMLELARLEQSAANQLALSGADKLENEIGAIAPRLMSASASQGVGQALQQGDLQKAMEELEALAQKVAGKELSQQELEQLARAMKMAAGELGKSGESSLAGDLSEGAEALKSGDSRKFSSSADSMSGKMNRLQQHRRLQRMRSKLGMTRAEMGQMECPGCGGEGCGQCRGRGQGQGKGQGKGQGEGGLEAGTGSTDTPFGERSRLLQGYREMEKVGGVMGDGPVETEVEVTGGQLGRSAVAARETHAEYAAVAEEAIEREEIPLSHRFHVKRYFQAIRPEE